MTSPALPLTPAAYDAMMRAAVAEARKRTDATRAFLPEKSFRNNVLLAQTNHDRELILSGPAGTSKTVGLLTKIAREMRNHPRLRVLFIRQVRAALAESALATWEIDVIGEDNPVCQNQKRQGRDVYRFPNGSIAVVGGLDQPKRWDGTFWDIIYVCQAEELTLPQWEMLTQRKARDGRYPHPQLLADVNPDKSDHWILQRATEGKLTLYSTTHQDNPKYWDTDAQEWTQIGRDYVLGTLGDLTGLRRERYLLGLWTSAEGAVYDLWDASMHVIDRFDIPAEWPRYRAIDFGYTNPFVCLWAAADPDGRLYLYREIYKTQTLVEDHAARIKELSAGERYQFTVADHDAEDRATLARHGINTVAAKKQVLTGIQAVSERLRRAGDGKPRLFIFRDALIDRDTALESTKKPISTRHEFGGYVWNDKVKKEEPVKADDHGLDAARYLVMAVDTRVAPKQSRNPFYGHGGE